jgi:hypothetical protein
MLSGPKCLELEVLMFRKSVASFVVSVVSEKGISKLVELNGPQGQQWVSLQHSIFLPETLNYKVTLNLNKKVVSKSTSDRTKSTERRRLAFSHFRGQHSNHWWTMLAVVTSSDITLIILYIYVHTQNTRKCSQLRIHLVIQKISTTIQQTRRHESNIRSKQSIWCPKTTVDLQTYCR